MDEVQETEQNESGSKIKAKTISKIFKFVSAIGIIACAIIKWLGFMPNATISEIVIAWAAVYGVGAGTIDLNIIFDKFTGGRREE